MELKGPKKEMYSEPDTGSTLIQSINSQDEWIMFQTLISSFVYLQNTQALPMTYPQCDCKESLTQQIVLLKSYVQNKTNLLLWY